VADAAGNRYLYLDNGMMARLSADGLSLTGPPVKVYDGWPIPGDWNVECDCLESPKLFSRGDYYYLVSAQGGTAGPSTSHMIVVARAKSPAGPWENMPSNPLLRTRDRAERWWSQGHGTILEAADGTWWVVYHAFENGYRTLGRQTLLMPIEWTPDGWPRVPAGADPGAPQKKPAGEAVASGLALSDAFSPAIAGWQWRRFDPGASQDDYLRTPNGLQVRARGTTAGEAALLTVAPVNEAYEVQVEARLAAGTQAGLLLHYDAENFDGVGGTPNQVVTFLKGRVSERRDRQAAADRIFFRIRNLHHDVQVFVSEDGTAWQSVGGSDMSGFHHDTFRNWSTLKVALFAAGSGTVTFRDFRYRGL
jgi:beta-xylosidase